MIKYKLTTQDLKTYNDFQWEIGKTVETSGEGDLYSAGWLHYYHDPSTAIILNPIHARINNPLLWEVEAEGEHKDDFGRKGGCTQMTLLKQIDVPVISYIQKIAFAILCAKKVTINKQWNDWADLWLNNTNRDGIVSHDMSQRFKSYTAAYDSCFAAYCFSRSIFVDVNISSYSAYAAYHAIEKAIRNCNLFSLIDCLEESKKYAEI